MNKKTKGEQKMNEEKRKRYKLKASQHTTAISTNDMPFGQNCTQFEPCIKKLHIPLKADGEVTTKAILNLNALDGDIFGYQLFKVIFNGLLDDIGILKYKITRADLRLDSYDKKHYAEFMKLNRYLISLIAVTYKISNTYRTLDLFSDIQLSQAIKCADFEVENYDKAAETARKGNTHEQAQSRLEVRSKAHNTVSDWSVDNLEKIFSDVWFKRWDKALKNINAVHKRYNDVLVITFYKESQSKYRKWETLNQFLRIHQEQIFCRKQMINLIERLGYDNAERRADKFKDKYNIEYFSQADIKYAIDEIKRATLEYFKS